MLFRVGWFDHAGGFDFMAIVSTTKISDVRHHHLSESE